MSYQPPYIITPAILNLVAEISESLGRLSVLEELAEQQDSHLRLRRINLKKSVHPAERIKSA